MQKEIIVLLVLLSVFGVVHAEPYQYTIVPVTTSWYRVEGCGDRQSMLQSSLRDYDFGSFADSLNWTSRKTQTLNDSGSPVNKWTNSYQGNIGLDEMVSRSGSAIIINITIPRTGLVVPALMRVDSSMWGSSIWDKFQLNITTAYSEYTPGYYDIYNPSNPNPFLIPLVNISSPLSLQEGEMLNVTFDRVDTDCVAEDYYSYKKIFLFYLDNSTAPSINSFSNLSTLHQISLTISGNVNTTLGIWYAEVNDSIHGLFNLTLSGDYPWEKNLSGAIPAFLNGSSSGTIRVCDEYGSCSSLEYNRTVYPAPDTYWSVNPSCPANRSVRDTFTCTGKVRNNGSNSTVFNATLWMKSSDILLVNVSVSLEPYAEKEVNFTVSTWPTKLLEEIGCHTVWAKILNSTRENDDNQEYLSDSCGFRALLSQFFAGALNEYVLAVDVYNQSGLLNTTAYNSSSTLDKVSVSCAGTNTQIRMYYNLTRIQQDGLTPVGAKMQKFNSSNGEYYNLTTDLPFVLATSVNTIDKYVYSNVSECSSFTLYLPPESQTPQGNLISTSPSSSSSGSGGGSSYREIVLLANEIDYELNQNETMRRWPSSLYRITRFDEQNFSRINFSIWKYEEIHILGGHEALQGIGEIVSRFTPLPVAGKFRYTEKFMLNGFPYTKRVIIYAGRNREDTVRLFKIQGGVQGWQDEE